MDNSNQTNNEIPLKDKAQKFISKIAKPSHVNTEATCSMTEQQVELLDQIYRCTLIGIQSVEAVINSVNTTGLLKELDRQMQAYKEINDTAVNLMNQNGLEIENSKKLSKALRWSSIKLSTLVDKSASHIADMMIIGSTMGVIEVTKAFNNCGDGANTQPKPLGRRLLKELKTSINNLSIHL